MINYNAAPDVLRSFSIREGVVTAVTAAGSGRRRLGDADHGVRLSRTRLGFVGPDNAGSLGGIVGVQLRGEAARLGYGPSAAVAHRRGCATTRTGQVGLTSDDAASPTRPAPTRSTKADQTITFAALADKTCGDADFSVSASASSGFGGELQREWRLHDPVARPRCPIPGAGTCTVTASQAGNNNYNAAPGCAAQPRSRRRR